MGGCYSEPHRRSEARVAAAFSERFAIHWCSPIKHGLFAMSNETFIVRENQRPSWLKYPAAFLRLVEQGLIHITPWHIMEAERALVHARGLAERYPSRELFPFAYRQDNDDVACLSRDQGQKVFVIHDFASAGWEDAAAFDDVWGWFRCAVEETIEWD